MIKVYNKVTNEMLGRITEADLAFLKEQLEEESLTDNDYYLRRETIEQFSQEGGGSNHLVEVLRGGLRHDNALEIRWEQD